MCAVNKYYMPQQLPIINLVFKEKVFERVWVGV
jgi:hypothetical protein